MSSTATPTVSVVTEAKDGFEIGDLDIQMDPELASRLQEFVERFKSGDCKDGDAFRGSTKRGRTRRGDPSFAISPQVICTTKDVVGNAGPNGPFGDILLFDTSKLHIDLSPAVAKGAEALGVLKEFIQGYAPLVLDAVLSDQLALLAFLLVYDALVENIPIGPHTRVKAGMLDLNKDKQDTSATQTSSGCPQPTKVRGLEYFCCRLAESAYSLLFSLLVQLRTRIVHGLSRMTVRAKNLFART